MSSLLEQIKGLIERTYDLSTGIDSIGDYVIGDTGWKTLYAGTEVTEHVTRARVTDVVRGAHAIQSGKGHPALPATARTLVRQDAGQVRLSLYYPDMLIDHLEAHPPLRSLSEDNIDAFATFVEELDHLLHLAHRARQERKVTLLELEWQANVTKFQVIRHLLARHLAPRPAGREVEQWVRFHLFEKFDYATEGPEVAGRYRDAVRLAVRTLDKMETLPPRARLGELRAFAQRSFAEKLRGIEH
ncbi:MAG: hypothetical protein V3U86_02420 [Acidobacteriota bacterium]|nr:hypothetical protein [Acidobacteriota bacterium]